MTWLEKQSRICNEDKWSLLVLKLQELFRVWLSVCNPASPANLVYEALPNSTV